MTAGYSGTPLPRKLGVKPAGRVLLDGAPAGFALAGVDTHRRAGTSPYDIVLLFAPDRRRLEQRWGPLASRLTVPGRLWVCWPKRASGRQTDLSENDVRDYGLAQGLVDVKVCAIDDTWSGLAFVRRLADR
ncbi:MAG: DUF3052 domain-containing protein [Frankiaceae bacterium]|nr:DUF3052 domain-containing protein [Frankiaceae bacterium]